MNFLGTDINISKCSLSLLTITKRKNLYHNDLYYYGLGVPDWEDESAVVSELTCLAIVGIEDPVRPEVWKTNILPRVH